MSKLVKVGNYRVMRPVLRESFAPKVYPQSDKTTVVVFGWVNADHRDLNKFGRLYEKRGFNTLNWTSTYHLWGLQRPLKESVAETSPIYDDLKKLLKDPEHKLIIHTLSMNGAWTVATTHLRYPELNLLGRTKGILLDSTPTKCDEKLYYGMDTVMYYAFPNFSRSKSPIDQLKLKLVQMFQRYTYYIWNLKTWKLSKDHTKGKEACVWRFMRDCPVFPKVQAYAYSLPDHICRPIYIEQLSEHHEKKEAKVNRMITNSPHLMHLRDHPKEYEQFVEKFLNNVFGVKDQIPSKIDMTGNSSPVKEAKKATA